MTEAKKTILRHLTDLKALDREIRSAIDRQLKDERLENQPDASRLIGRIEGTLAQQSERLEKRIDALGGSSTKDELKERLAKALGFVEGLWQNLRDKPVSLTLRDDYAALNVAAFHYTMLHATARALDDRTTADLAFQNLRELTPLIVEISQVAPGVVVAETAEEHEGVDLAAATEAAKTTHQAWQPKVAKTSETAKTTA